MDTEIEILSPDARRIVPEGTRLEQVATGFIFTEGPLWDSRDDSLLFSDIPADRIYRWKPGSAAEVFREPSGKSNGLTWDGQGRLLACEHMNRRVSATNADGTVLTLADSYHGKRLNSPNDLVVHSSGNIYFSDPPYGIQSTHVGAIADQEQPLNGLYLLRPGESEPELVASDFDRPNGLAFSPEESVLYVNDTPRYHVRVLGVRPDGTLEGGKIVAQFSADEGEGRPDGMKVDVDGNVYTTGPGGLWILDPSGKRLAHVRFPEKTANCAWGEDGESLFVTATSSVYRLRLRVPGVLPRLTV